MKNLPILLLLFVSTLDSNAQILDTTIQNINYQLTADSSSLGNWIFTITNNREAPFEINKFGVNNNKPLYKNSKNEPVSYDFIECGVGQSISLPPKASKAWYFRPFSLVEENPFVSRPRSIEWIDSLYQISWRVKDHILGPFPYASKRDLIKLLASKNLTARDRAFELLKKMDQLNAPFFIAGNGLDRRDTRCLYQGPRQSILELKFFENGTIDSIAVLKKEEDFQVLPDPNYTGELKTCYANGQLLMLAHFRQGKREGSAMFYQNDGSLCRISHYSNGAINKTIGYYRNGKKSSEKIYHKGKLLKSTNYDLNGNFQPEKKKVKRKY